MTLKKNTIKKSKKQNLLDEEKLSILMKADQVKGEQLTIGTDGGIIKENEIKKFNLDITDDPEKKYDLYYKGIHRLLIKNLPKGPSNKSARDFIYEEKNTYLTRGHRKNHKGIRGADSRMTYITDAEELYTILVNWVVAKSTMIELFNNLRDLNISKGYGKSSII